MENLGDLLASVAHAFEKREEQIMERVRELEGRVQELEGRLRDCEDELKECREKMQEQQQRVEEGPVAAPVVQIVEPEGELDIEFEFGEEPDDIGQFDEVEEIAAVEELEEVEDVQEVEDVFEVEEAREEDVLEEEDVRADDVVLVMEKAKPDWYDWEVDIPGPYLDDIWNGIGLNDRILFLNELFGGDEEDFSKTVQALNGMDNLVEAAGYIRARFPQWNEEGDEVYRFYMTVRRRFVKQRQEEF